jgi:hydrogenase-4 transcriptional activator
MAKRLQIVSESKNALRSATDAPTDGREAIRLLLDQGLMTEARERIASLMTASRAQPSQMAEARILLSLALEMQSRYRDALDAVSMYEAADKTSALDETIAARMRVRIGVAYSYTGDHPKAVALLKAALRDAIEKEADAQIGEAYIALARVYRGINEYTISRDYAQKSLEYFRRTGDWRGLADAYFATGMTNMFEGRFEATIEDFEQVIKIVGDRPATYLLGRVNHNMAGACWFLQRWHEGIRCLERSISYYERTEHKIGVADGYNNLGMFLMVTGEWDRAQASFQRALALVSEIDENSPKLPMFLDSLAQLRLMRGDLSGAREMLERAVELATAHGNRRDIAQATRSLGHCLIALQDATGALVQGNRALALAESIGDHQALCDALLLLAEAHLHNDQLDDCAERLEQLIRELADSSGDLAFVGKAQHVHGQLAMRRYEMSLAVQHFGRSLSIFELLGDRYRGARARFELGRALASLHPERASENLAHAARAFRELGAPLDLARVESEVARIALVAPQAEAETITPANLLTMRLTDAVASRELLLRELAAIVNQELGSSRVLIIEPNETKAYTIVVAHGYTETESAQLAECISQVKTVTEFVQVESKQKAAINILRSPHAQPAILIFETRDAQSDKARINPLLRIAELGLDLCALREQARTTNRGLPFQDAPAAEAIPGFIHSSPAMTRLVEEIHKIRSSDVTVLVTGESGTGKELVARAVHSLSSRKDKIFVPFNCTAVPKELSDAYLFGYRRGAFTGAMADSAGVIRAAAGGTLFLDEIGDLPLDIQPKLLRFLQEGEIQPLGEQRPVSVDVRIVAATNTDLETMVTEGRFREDLYYRLNVIRLRVPPLRERRSEIPLLVNHFINLYSSKFNRKDIQIAPQTLDLMMVCDWPGNVRQLSNEIQRIVARAEDGTMILPDHLSTEIRRASDHTASAPETGATHFALATAGGTLADARAEFEHRFITEVLNKHNGNISRAARELGLTRRGLYLKLERRDLSATA